MKKMKKLFAIFAVAALVGMFASCSDLISDDPFATDNAEVARKILEVPGKEIVFSVKEASTDAENTVLLIKYDRSAAGANEKISIIDAELKVWKGSDLIKTFDKIDFELDGYGAFFTEGQEGKAFEDCTEEEKNNLKEYKAKLSIGQTVAANDTVKVQLAKGTIIGEGVDKVDFSDITVALLDVSESAGWYKELSETEYVPINGNDETDDTGGGTNNSLIAAYATDFMEDNFVVWEGEAALAWSSGDNNGAVIDGSKITDSTVGLRFTYTTDDSDSHCMKFLNADTWQDVILKKIEGNGSLADSGDDKDKAVYLWQSQTDATVIIYWSDDIAGTIKNNGIKFFGDGATITKVELVK